VYFIIALLVDKMKWKWR